MNTPSQTYGIEDVRVYPTTLSLDIGELADARGLDREYVARSLFTDQRGVNPPWEDPVTMAVNAAETMLERIDRDTIGLLIVGTETGLDQEKPLSSWIHRHLRLSPHCRNFEIKYACYGTTAALHMALAWLRTPEGAGRRALLINTDLSLPGFGQPYEPMEGAGAVAVLVSAEPRLVAYDLDASGIYTQDVTDVIRPTPWIEVLNEESLYSYLEALEGAYEHYERKAGGTVDFGRRFARSIYHVPFGGMAYRAHRRLLDVTGTCTRAESDAHFCRHVLPSLTYTRRIGSTYGGSTFIALLGLIDTDAALNAGDRLSIFGFGSGYCGEFYSATVLPDARDVARRAALDALLDARRPLTIDEYEACERQRAESTGQPDMVPDRTLLGDWYARAYDGRRRLVLAGTERHHRVYEWS